MIETPTYRRIEQLAEDYSDFQAAELHGSLSGMLCSNAGVEFESWLRAIFTDEAETVSAAHRGLLTSLYEATKAELASPDLGFGLLLPDDEQPLSERTRALGEWCQGFLFGIGQGLHTHQWSEDSDEILRDLVEISRIETEGTSAEDEEAYMQITEYVRMGVQLIQSESAAHPQHRLH